MQDNESSARDEPFPDRYTVMVECIVERVMDIDALSSCIAANVQLFTLLDPNLAGSCHMGRVNSVHVNEVLLTKGIPKSLEF